MVEKVECSLGMLIINGYLSNSALHAFGVFLCTCKTYLQNSACKDSVGCLSQQVKL